MRASLNGSLLDPALPAKAVRSVAGYSALARRDDFKRFAFLVTSRTFPPDILDDSLLDRFSEYIAVFGVDLGAEKFKAQLSMRERALLRAVSINVTRQKKEGLWVE